MPVYFPVGHKQFSKFNLAATMQETISAISITVSIGRGCHGTNRGEFRRGNTPPGKILSLSFEGLPLRAQARRESGTKGVR